ncbi:hypothetical protein BRD01_01105 [Halobacteriales archaeon QS_8_65_32]|nr:MAG: hypothetical protein BRD01_01105 [Halobacteriales archaeon QS_8_65_32]
MEGSRREGIRPVRLAGEHEYKYEYTAASVKYAKGSGRSTVVRWESRKSRIAGSSVLPSSVVNRVVASRVVS